MGLEKRLRSMLSDSGEMLEARTEALRGHRRRCLEEGVNSLQDQDYLLAFSELKYAEGYRDSLLGLLGGLEASVGTAAEGDGKALLDDSSYGLVKESHTVIVAYSGGDSEEYSFGSGIEAAAFVRGFRAGLGKDS